MKHYIDAYRELNKAMSKFGVTLSFVVSSLYTTIDVMDGYMKHDKDKHYEHVDRMIRYEMNNKLVQQKVTSFHLADMLALTQEERTHQ